MILFFGHENEYIVDVNDNNNNDKQIYKIVFLCA